MHPCGVLAATFFSNPFLNPTTLSQLYRRRRRERVYGARGRHPEPCDWKEQCSAVLRQVFITSKPGPLDLVTEAGMSQSPCDLAPMPASPLQMLALRDIKAGEEV